MTDMESISKKFIDKLRFTQDGLIPAIAQDWLDGSILMMAWMNRISIEATIQTGEVHYWSRSRQELWHKGATSGHTQILKGIRYDCDADTMLLTIEQTNDIACHTGERSCFFETVGINTPEGKQLNSQPPSDTCSELFRVINNRCSVPEPESYTNYLLEGGDNRILKKIGEESAEFVMACKDKDQDAIANEAADLIFHIQVALANHKVNWREVLKVLARRRAAPRRK